MTVIHISGSSASGKSFAGNVLSKMYTASQLKQVDLDQLFAKAFRETENISDAEARFVEITRRCQHAVAEVCKRHRTVLLIGYSDLLVDGKIRYIDFGATKKYFIAISTEDLIRQFRSRDKSHIVNSRGKSKKFTDNDIAAMAADDRRVYKGYRRMPQMKIIQDIIMTCRS